MPGSWVRLAGRAVRFGGTKQLAAVVSIRMPMRMQEDAHPRSLVAAQGLANIDRENSPGREPSRS